jgi:hypothetical protein
VRILQPTHTAVSGYKRGDGGRWPPQRGTCERDCAAVWQSDVSRWSYAPWKQRCHHLLHFIRLELGEQEELSKTLIKSRTLIWCLEMPAGKQYHSTHNTHTHTHTHTSTSAHLTERSDAVKRSTFNPTKPVGATEVCMHVQGLTHTTATVSFNSSIRIAAENTDFLLPRLNRGIKSCNAQPTTRQCEENEMVCRVVAP